MKNLQGAKRLNKSEQQSIKGGKKRCNDIPTAVCPPGWCCTAGGYCVIIGSGTDCVPYIER